MCDLSGRVLRTIRDYDLIGPGGRVVVALSGGPDSVALTYLLRELAATDRICVVAVAHLNHRLRAAADADEVFCRELAARVDLPIEVGVMDIADLARTSRRSIEHCGRIARYRFLDRVRTQLGADRVAVGHTRDDQAETFLLKLVRGAGPRGLGGIYPRRGSVVRPLLEISRQEVMVYLERRGLRFREDETNADLGNPRNRVRHELLPYLRREFSSGIAAVLAREATLARDDAVYLDRVAGSTAGELVRSVDTGVEVNVRALAAAPTALARRVVRDVLSNVGGRFVGFDHVEAVLRLARPVTQPGGGMDVPGARVVRQGDRILVSPAASRPGRDGRQPSSLGGVLPVPGELRLPELGLVLTAERMDALPAPEREGLSARGNFVAVEARAVADPLAVRMRRPGDRIRPLGLRGRKKLQDFFVDRKVKRSARDRIPLVVDARDRIVWVVGQTLDDDFRVTEQSQGVIILKAKWLAGG